MTATTRIVAGPAKSGKTARLLAEYRQHLAGGVVGNALWLGPTHRGVQAIREQLLNDNLVGCLAPQCLTFDQFAVRILEASPAIVRSLRAVEARQLLRRVVDEAQHNGRLAHFGAIAHTSGFLDLLAAFLQEIKRVEVWPEELKSAFGPRSSARDRELCELYEQYQAHLNRHHLYDRQGRFWMARALLRDGQTRPFESLRHVFVDGFADFTRTELEVLAILAGRVQSLTITLPWDDRGSRSVLFQKSTRATQMLQAAIPTATREILAANQRPPSALAHLERTLFDNTRSAVEPPDAAGVEILCAAGTQGEIESVARRIKRLLLAGDAGQPVRPSDILVIYRSLGDHGELVREVFTELGVLVSVESAPRLHRAPLTRALLEWLQLDNEDWPFRRLLSVVEHNYLRPPPEVARSPRDLAAAERVVRWLQVSSGRQEFLAALRRLAASPVSVESEEQQSSMAEDARRVLPIFEWLAGLFNVLPARASWPQWIAALDELVKAARFLTATGEPPSPADVSAWQQLHRALAGCGQLAETLDAKSAEISRAEFLQALSDVVHTEPIGELSDNTGVVRVLTAESARNLTAPYVFLAGLSEQSFPRLTREDCLLDRAASRRLVDAGLPMLHVDDLSRYEMLLFYEMVTRATRALVLSYPAIDASAQPLSPSPYLSEVERAFGKTQIPRSNQAELHVLPTADDLLSPRDVRLRAAAELADGDGGLFRRMSHCASMANVAENISAALVVSAERRASSFGPFEGLFTSEAARKLLESRFGAQRIWSPSQLELYAACPFRFLLERVLAVESPADAELAADYAGRGRMLHWLLATLHREILDQQKLPPQARGLDDDAFARRVPQLVAEWLARLRSDRPLSNGLRQIDALRVQEWLARYASQKQTYEEQWSDWDHPPRPAHFEVGFGPRRKGQGDEDQLEQSNVDELTSDEAFELVCGGESIRFSGRIDRIDIGRHGGQTVFSVVDYKSGRALPGAKDVQSGTALQLPLYALAAERLLAGQDALPFRGAYWHVTGKGYQELIQFYTDEAGRLHVNPQWQALGDYVGKRVAELVSGIRGGQFPMASIDDDCTSHCEFSTVCRVNQTRSLKKPWPPQNAEAGET